MQVTETPRRKMQPQRVVRPATADEAADAFHESPLRPEAAPEIVAAEITEVQVISHPPPPATEPVLRDVAPSPSSPSAAPAVPENSPAAIPDEEFGAGLVD